MSLPVSLAKGLTPVRPDSDGNTALMMAAAAGRLGCGTMLLADARGKARSKWSTRWVRRL
ncbi:MAG: hypothetical protein R3D67_14530 [Hyphomicrobiaceae bacterium]